jgi:hypothetical protein
MPALRIAAVAVVALAFCGGARAAGGDYVFAGGTTAQQAQVRAALDASAFDWSMVPAEITIHIGPNLPSESTRGELWLDSNLLGAGMFAYGVVQHEYAHEVDFFLLDDARRAQLQTALGGTDWCGSGGAHDSHGCERFASTLAWAYWPSSSNCMKPQSSTDESAAMAPAAFRALLAQLIGAPRTLQLRRR